MTNTTFNTRILLKYDLYTNWTTINPVLKAGEVAIATIPAAEGATSLNHNSVTLPQVLIKVGDGTSHYNTLPFASALAADVYPWAKESLEQFNTRVGDLVRGLTYVKADLYNKSEIDAFLAQYYKKTEIDALTGSLTDLNTTNKNNLVAAINEALQAVEVGGTGSVVSVVKEDTPTEGSQATYKVTQGGNTVGVKIEIPQGYDETALAGRVSAIEGDYVKAANIADFATRTEAEGYANAKDEAIAAAKKAGDDAQADVDALADLVGTLPEGATETTVVDYINAKTANIASNDTVNGIDERLAAVEGDYLKTADKTALQEQITANANAITTLTNGVDPEKIDGLNDLVEWADTHAPEVASIKEDIEANTTAIEAEVTRATGAEEALAGRVKNLEDNTAGYATTTEVATAKQEAIDAAAGDATTKANKALEDAQADAAEKYELKGVAQGLVDGLGATYETINGAAGKYATIENHNALAERVTATEGVANAASAKANANETAFNEYKTANDAAVALKADKTELFSGKIDDLTQDNYIILYCGTAEEVM